MIRLLIVDDSPLMRRLMGGIFGAQGDFEVAFARNGVEALAQIARFEPHVVTLDVHMPEMDGLTCLDRIMIERPCPVVMVSSLTEAGARETLRALELGAVDFVPKPTGAVSLGIGELAPQLVEKVRAASRAKLRRSLRLTERVRLKTGGAAAPSPPVRVTAPAMKPTRFPGSPAPGLVLVGTSTGGPPALDALLSPLPADFPWPILVAQHMPASFTGSLAARLDRLCALTVTEVVGPALLLPGHVYVAKGDADMIVSVRQGELVAMAAPASAQYRWHPSVDRLVQSAMAHVGPAHLIGVLMTGMGNDGATTMTALRAQGGRTLAEAEETAVVWGMPGELVKAGGADIVAPLESLADRLREVVPWS